MQATVLYGERDIRFEDRPEPTIVEASDAIIRLPVTCICGSDLWPYRGIQAVSAPVPMGHEYCGVVEEVGRGVTSIKPGQFVIGSFFASDNTCPHCRHGYQTSCQRFEAVVGAQAPRMRVPLAEGTLVATRDVPDTDMIPSLLALSDVMGTGWFAADAANVKPGATVVVVGDGAVGLLGVLSAKQMGAERIIAMSRHESRQTARARVRRNRHRHRAWRRGRRAHQAADQRRRGRFGTRVRWHSGVDDAGHQSHSPRRLRGLRRRAAWCVA